MEVDCEAPQDGPPAADGGDAGPSLEEKAAWAADMRRRFSPPGMCLPSGEIDQSFFQPKRIIIQLTDRGERERWGPAQRDALYRGLEEKGVGKWREMAAAYPELAGLDDATLRIKAARLLGTQSLARHVGWRGGRDAVDAEHAKHKALGERLGCWKAGVLVEDDKGSVAAAIAAGELQ